MTSNRQKRYFNVTNENNESLGKFEGKNPRHAGSIAFSKWMTKIHKDDDDYEVATHEIYVEECTDKNADNKLYSYLATRKKWKNQNQQHILIKQQVKK